MIIDTTKLIDELTKRQSTVSGENGIEPFEYAVVYKSIEVIEKLWETFFPESEFNTSITMNDRGNVVIVCFTSLECVEENLNKIMGIVAGFVENDDIENCFNFKDMVKSVKDFIIETKKEMVRVDVEIESRDYANIERTSSFFIHVHAGIDIGENDFEMKNVFTVFVNSQSTGDYMKCRNCGRKFSLAEANKMHPGEECECGKVLIPVPWRPGIEHTATILKKKGGD